MDTGVGGAFEKLRDVDGTSSGAFRVGESLAWQLSKSAKLTQGAAAGLKKNDTAFLANIVFKL